ncbi:MAG: glycoside hydrolase family 43 protein [Lachnospiraceae bacterium]|nr:glycoside hydrolase family 43 protein [Lachnospiraceae bacterium]
MNKKFVVKMLLVFLLAGMLGGCGNGGTNSDDTSQVENRTAVPEESTLSERDTSSSAEQSAQLETSSAKEEETEMVEVSYSRVSVHDPSVIYDNGTYYIFGTHMAWAKSTDLMNWESFQMNINADYAKLFGKEWEEYCETASNPNLNGNLWAPDVIYNPNMDKYCFYMSVNGDDWNSVIVLLTADSIEGPYDYVGPVVYSGFNTGSHDVKLTDVYQVLGEGADLTRYQNIKNTKLNAIDPCVIFDEEGSLWMVFGSWFGGLYMLRLDENTGLRDYTTTYETIPNEQDAYYGYKIHGGFGVSGEGPYIIEKDGYYYLFVSYGGLVADGGYQIRIFRSDKITGPYVDEAGNNAVYTKECNDLFEKVGVRIMGSYDWTGNREIRVAQGHNSAYVTEEGEIFMVYHSRFAGGKNGISEAHEVRVQQLFVNEDGWLVAAPYEYAGEKISETGYSVEEMCGEYEFIVHTPTTYYQTVGSNTLGIMQPSKITLNEDGTVTGELEGSWTYTEGTPNMTVTVDGVTYKGVFVEMPSEQLYFNPNERKVVMTFTALGGNVAVWGSQ